MTAGLLAVASPSGLGVREAVLVAALSPFVGVGTALGVALASRLILTVADVLAAGAAAWSARGLRRPKGRASRSPPCDPAPGAFRGDAYALVGRGTTPWHANETTHRENRSMSTPPPPRTSRARRRRRHPLVSLVVPAFNEAENVLGLVDLVTEIAASHPDHRFELILVDDGSTDGTPAAPRDGARGQRHHGTRGDALSQLRLARGDHGRASGPPAATAP